MGPGAACAIVLANLRTNVEGSRFPLGLRTEQSFQAFAN